MDESFKKCPLCAHHWQKLVDLIRDGDLVVNGYQASFDDAHEGLFLLTHNVTGCGTTFAITAGSLKILYDGPEYSIHMALTENCKRHCLCQNDFESCSNECDMKWARDILQILIHHGSEDLFKKLEASNDDEPPVLPA